MLSSNINRFVVTKRKTAAALTLHCSGTRSSFANSSFHLRQTICRCDSLSLFFIFILYNNTLFFIRSVLWCSMVVVVLLLLSKIVAGMKRYVWLYSLYVVPVVDVNCVTKFIERRQPVKWYVNCIDKRRTDEFLKEMWCAAYDVCEQCSTTHCHICMGFLNVFRMYDEDVRMWRCCAPNPLNRT